MKKLVLISLIFPMSVLAKDLEYYKNNLNEAQKVAANCDLVLNALAKEGDIEKMVEWTNNENCANAIKAFKQDRLKKQIKKIAESNAKNS